MSLKFLPSLWCYTAIQSSWYTLPVQHVKVFCKGKGDDCIHFPTILRDSYIKYYNYIVNLNQGSKFFLVTAGQLFIFSIIRFECCLFLNLYKVLGCSWYSWKNGFQVFCHSIQWLENSEFRKSNLNYHYNIPRTNAMGTSWNNNRYCVSFVKSFVLFCFEARIYHTMHITHPAPSFTSCNSPRSFCSLTIRFFV